MRSVESRRGTLYRYIITLALSLKFPQTQPVKAKIDVVDNPTVQGTPMNIYTNIILPEIGVPNPTFLSSIAWVSLLKSSW